MNPVLHGANPGGIKNSRYCYREFYHCNYQLVKKLFKVLDIGSISAGLIAGAGNFLSFGIDQDDGGIAFNTDLL
jgi:hypothetical protein